MIALVLYYLFNTLMKKIIESVNSKANGYRLDTHQIKILCFADDARLICENEDDLQRLFFVFNAIGTKYHDHFQVRRMANKAAGI